MASVGESLLLLAIGGDGEVTLLETVELVQQNDGTTLLVATEESLNRGVEVTRGLVLLKDDVEDVANDGPVHDISDGVVVLHPCGAVGLCRNRAVDVVEQTMASE